MFTLGVVHSMGLDRSKMMCISHYGIVENSFGALQTFCPPPPHPPSPRTPGNHRSLCCLYCFAFSNVLFS